MPRHIVVTSLILLLAACQANNPRKPQTPAHDSVAKSAPVKAAPIIPRIDPTLTGPQKLPMIFAPGSAPYPKELGERGVQGEVKVSVQVDPSGLGQQVRLLQSSRNPLLDHNALKLAQTVKYRLEKRRSVTELEPVELSIGFYTHYLETFGLKTCAQFLKEVDYFKKTFPERPADEVFGYHGMGGMAAFLALTKNPNSTLKGSTLAQDIAYCQTNPQKPLMLHLFEVNGAKLPK